MKIKSKLLLSAFVLSGIFLVSARGPEAKKDPKKETEVRPSLAAGCSPAIRITYLEFNNVRTRIETGGLWWQDRANGRADYEVPKGSNSYALYAGGLWLAGTDVNGQLKAAVSKFGQGVDYWAGPLDTTGTAEIDDVTCSSWDRFFEISKAEVLEFVLWNQAKQEGTAAEDFPDYQVPQSIIEWPGNGDQSKEQAAKLAPYVDVDRDGRYDYLSGDYPFYDLGPGFNTFVDPTLLTEAGAVDCRAPRIDRSESSKRPLFGDKTYWWIFNDKGNLHTESNAPSIGMEIHGQAFAFATNDEVNDMTFYNFELINRSTFTLTDTYFASYVDPDLGNPQDDYVGCDVERGFGFCYNADDLDEDFQGQTGYGSTPAVIGIDFFEGPYQDADGIDNEVGIGPGEALNGLGYGDSIVDNERFGMRRFVYYNIGPGNNGDPQLAIHYYNYMRGIWQNGQRMRHGGDGFNSNDVEDIPTAFMFPGTSDPQHWGTTDENGVTQVPANTNWTESRPAPGGGTPNEKGDRRFLQSAGPFTLEPGNVNDITVGVVFAQAESGGNDASLAKSITADDRAQALFDNCFQVLNGPDAPELTIQELDQELIFYISNPEISNNYREEYEEEDPNIITPDNVLAEGITYDNKYRFQGYQVFQLKSSDVSVNQVGDISLARPVFQCDISDGVTTITNFEFDEGLQASRPSVKVVGENEGISHTFRVTQDQFAQGNSGLVNYKTYYYIAIAYAYNNYKPYAQDQAPDPDNVLAPAYDGQKIPYLSSRQAAGGGSIQAVPAIPHRVTAEERGTVVNSSYGDLIQITRLQGRGNGNNALELTDETVNRLMEEKTWEDSAVNPVRLDYKLGKGPINVKVVDPLNVVDGQFYFKLLDNGEKVVSRPQGVRDTFAIVSDTAKWMIWKEGTQDTIYSEYAINTRNEQLLFDPNWGLSVLVEQGELPGRRPNSGNGSLGATITYDDPSQPWFGGINDEDGLNPYNWIASGESYKGPDDATDLETDYNDRRFNTIFMDPKEDYEGLLGGIVAPYQLVHYHVGTKTQPVNRLGYNQNTQQYSSLNYLNSTLVVLTKDKSKWTRSPVFEMQEDPIKSANGDDKFDLRSAPSVDKNGVPFDTTGLNITADSPYDSLRKYASSNPEDANYTDPFGMGWFPGYAINIETGERLNIAFGEDSWLGGENGDDMMWNPTDKEFSGANGELVWGGKHPIYIFRKTLLDVETSKELSFVFQGTNYGDAMPVYDGAKAMMRMLRISLGTTALYPNVWDACSWVFMPMLNPGQELLATDVKINLNVTRPYNSKKTELDDESLENDGRPVYAFETKGVAVQKNRTDVLSDALDEINVVPNPYYAVSQYEATALENLVKITNLPAQCKIRIYNMSGTLIREFNKSDPANFLNWDLSNQVGIPISSGVYIIHVEVPGVGEKILKWFGVMRPVDLNNF